MSSSSSNEAVVQMIVGGIRLYVYGFEKIGKTDPANLETREALSVVFVAHGRLGEYFFLYLPLHNLISILH